MNSRTPDVQKLAARRRRAQARQQQPLRASVVVGADALGPPPSPPPPRAPTPSPDHAGFNRAQDALAPAEDLGPYAGEWVAVRGGRVVGHAMAPADLLAAPDVRPDDLVVAAPSSSAPLVA